MIASFRPSPFTKESRVTSRLRDSSPTPHAVRRTDTLDGAAVSLQLQGGDADGETVTYTASGLPTGLSISSSGLISGTIATNADGSSPYSVTISASDGTNTTTQTFLWTVSQLPLTAPSAQTNTEGDTVSLQLQGKNGVSSFFLLPSLSERCKLAAWVEQTASRLGLELVPRRRGRPRKTIEK